MKKRLIILFLVLLSAITAVSADHGQEHEVKSIDILHEEAMPYPIWTVVGWGTLLFAALIFSMVQFGKKMGSRMKQFVFALLVMTTLFVTAYLIITTVYLNVISESGGPVHWHADYEVWACGKEFDLINPKFPGNKIGNPILHEHNENRIHIEGVVLQKQGVSLAAYFQVIGGEITDTRIGYPTNEAYMFYENGMLCNGNPGTLYAFVDGEQITDIAAYVIEPFMTIPPGDTIKIIFTDQPLEEIDPYTSQYGRERKL